MARTRGNNEGSITRLDPATNEIIATIPVGTRLCQAIGATDDAIWACTRGGIVQVDPEANEVTGTIELPTAEFFGYLPSGDGALWVPSGEVTRTDQLVRIDPGTATICPSGMEGVDPVGNNTWYYVHTLAVFYIHEVLVQGPNVDECASPPGGPPVPVTTGSGFLGCIKGWFVNYVTSGPVDPEGEIGPGGIGIQLIR